jgi:two-component system sensor histidine kinase KdpD
MTRGPRFTRFGAERASKATGVLVAALAVAGATGAIYALKSVAPTVSLSVVYLPAVLLISAYWGLALGLLTSIASAVAFNFFHIPPLGRFTIAHSRDWIALAAFVLVAVVMSTIAELARARTLEAERRRGEADLAAGLARELLAGAQTLDALGATARRVAKALMMRSAAIELGAVAPSERRVAIALHGGDGEQIATLFVPADLPSETLERLRSRVVPSLEALVAIALRRDAVRAEEVETAALRRSDELKTSLLRAVSHDLRTPVTAVVAAGHALGAASLTTEERGELSAAVVQEGERLSALIDKLLDLSRLQAGRAEPQSDWISIEDVLLAAREALPPGSEVRVSIDADVPVLRADGGQLEQVFANLLENASRYSDGRPISVHVRRSGPRVLTRVVDQGPGISRADQERIFEPFYQGAQAGSRTWKGSGLGLAIAKGFVEANGGRISVESLPGQGTSFVVELPVAQDQSVSV